MRLSTSRLLLRPLEEDDAQAFFAYRRLPQVGRYQSFHPSRLEEAQAFIHRQPSGFGEPETWFQLAIEREGALVGDLGVHFVGEQQVEVGFTLAPTSQGQGFATEALCGLLGRLFPDKHRAFASVDPRNPASMAVLDRVGFRREGTLRRALWFKGEWVDDVVYGLLASEWTERGG